MAGGDLLRLLSAPTLGLPGPRPAGSCVHVEELAASEVAEKILLLRGKSPQSS